VIIAPSAQPQKNRMPIFDVDSTHKSGSYFNILSGIQYSIIIWFYSQHNNNTARRCSLTLRKIDNPVIIGIGTQIKHFN